MFDISGEDGSILVQIIASQIDGGNEVRDGYRAWSFRSNCTLGGLQIVAAEVRQVTMIRYSA